MFIQLVGRLPRLTICVILPLRSVLSLRSISFRNHDAITNSYEEITGKSRYFAKVSTPIARHVQGL